MPKPSLGTLVHGVGMGLMPWVWAPQADRRCYGRKPLHTMVGRFFGPMVHHRGVFYVCRVLRRIRTKEGKKISQRTIGVILVAHSVWVQQYHALLIVGLVVVAKQLRDNKRATTARAATTKDKKISFASNGSPGSNKFKRHGPYNEKRMFPFKEG